MSPDKINLATSIYTLIYCSMACYHNVFRSMVAYFLIDLRELDFVHCPSKLCVKPRNWCIRFLTKFKILHSSKYSKIAKMNKVYNFLWFYETSY